MKYYVATVLAMLLWASSFIATKIAYQSFSPIFLSFVRIGLSTVLLFIWRLFQKEKKKIDRKDLKPVILSALGGISLYYTLENIGLSLTSASMTSLIEASYPVIVVVVGILFYHEKTSKRMLAGIAVSVLGVVLLTGFSTKESNMTGNIILLLDGFLWGFYNYLVQQIPERYDSLTITYYQMIFGTVGFVPLLFLEETVCVEVTAKVILAVIYLSLGSSIAALLLYNYGLQGIPATHASALMNVMPLFGVILSAVLLGESVTVNQILGGIIIILGVFISTGKKA